MRKRDQIRRFDFEGGLLGGFACCADFGRTASVLGGQAGPVRIVDSSAREDPESASEVQLRVAPKHENFHACGCITQKNHGGSWFVGGDGFSRLGQHGATF